MLTDKERSLLAPSVALIRTTRAELAQAQQEAATARLRLDEAADGTDWLDRSFGGLFSREPARARAYHDARRAHAGRAAAIARREKRLARLDRRFDARIRPMMPRLHPGYERFAAAIKQCDHALRECRHMQQRIAMATASARTASVNPGQNDKGDRTAERARHRYRQLVTKVRKTAPAVGQALDSARRAVRAAGAEAQHLAWNTALFDQLPQAAADLSARRRPAATRDPLRRLNSQLNQTIDTIKRWRTETTSAEAKAVAATRNRLINESGP